MTTDFEEWLSEVAPLDDLDPGPRPAGADQALREIFERLGPISVDELAIEGERIQNDLANRAVAVVLRDLHGTTSARPNIDVRRDEEYGLIVSYNGGWATPVMTSVQDPEATCEIADYLQGEIVEDSDVWSAWPTCPTHENGLHAEVHYGAATWYCRTGKHPVKSIGQLAP